MKTCLVFVVLILILVQVAYAEEGLVPLRIVRWIRPNLLLGEVVQEGESQRVRVRLAGVVLPVGNDRVYEQAFQRVRELTKGKEVQFDFVLGHGPEEKTWVGYIYIPLPESEESLILNAELLREGLVTLDESDVGRNLLGYFIEAQNEAQDKKVGLWTVMTRPRRKTEECPSCEIR
ncbi:MAG: thermonuclease family protein [Atribacterota bacterium]